MRLFKYLHPERTAVLKDATVRFSSPKVLNDPFELQPHIFDVCTPSELRQTIKSLLPKHFEEAYERYTKQFGPVLSLQQYSSLAEPKVTEEVRRMWATVIRERLPEFRQVLHDKVSESFGILCLSESPDSLLMWAHYSDAHQGFLIECDSESAFFKQQRTPDDDFRYLRKVHYQEERLKRTLTELDFTAFFLTKSREWSYEAEWRMLMPLSEATRVHGEGPKAVHLFAFPKSMVRRVILGCRMSEEKVAEINGILGESAEYQHVSCVQARIAETQYRLVIPGVNEGEEPVISPAPVMPTDLTGPNSGRASQH